jgi:hypothetical protein
MKAICGMASALDLALATALEVFLHGSGIVSLSVSLPCSHGIVEEHHMAHYN